MIGKKFDTIKEKYEHSEPQIRARFDSILTARLALVNEDEKSQLEVQKVKVWQDFEKAKEEIDDTR